MKRTKEETVIATENEQGHERVDNEMIEGAKMEIIPILPISAARKRARITYVEEKRQLPRFQYEPLKALDTRNTNSNSNTSVEVRICSTLINTKNEALKKRCLWGWKTYSSDSDLVCILVHLGIIPYPTAVSAKNPYPLPYKELIVTLEIIDAVKSPAERITLPSHEYNGIRSRFWEAYRDNRISVKNVRANAEKSMPGKAISIVPYQLPKLMVMPTVSISSISRSMAMRCCFDASNNPALVYSLFIVADRKTPKRLSKEVLYLEDGNNMRYEISRIDKKQRAAAVATVPEDEKKKGLYVRFGMVACGVDAGKQPLQTEENLLQIEENRRCFATAFGC